MWTSTDQHFSNEDCEACPEEEQPEVVGQVENPKEVPVRDEDCEVCPVEDGQVENPKEVPVQDEDCEVCPVEGGQVENPEEVPVRNEDCEACPEEEQPEVVGQVENPKEVPDNGSMVESSLTETHRHHRMEKDMEEEVDHSSDEDYAPGDDEQVSDSDDSVAIGNMDKNLFTDLKSLRKKSKTLGEESVSSHHNAGESNSASFIISVAI
ncbi:uncharacterized protein LOC135493658 [Lineus longissimus]|uniref:uncharacterized protein LOC135493658 n=1 Tax=Lineus longissimus TaxID=88925 RepID=UPI00315CDB83